MAKAHRPITAAGAEENYFSVISSWALLGVVFFFLCYGALSLIAAPPVRTLASFLTLFLKLSASQGGHCSFTM